MQSETFPAFMKNMFVNDFMPHGHCYFWRPDIVWLHVLSDGGIALAYYAIPFILLFFMMKRKDFPFPWVLVLFGAFILLCGTTHIMDIVTLWDPVYRLDGVIRAATAIVSIFTAVLLIPLVPLALNLKSPKELEAANLKLADANDKLKEIDRLKDNFFSNISHELRTPLTLILAPLESLLAKDYGDLSPMQQKNLEAMHNNSIRLFQMVNSILDFAKITAKKIVIKREPLDVILLTKSIVHEFEPMVKQKKINITFSSSLDKKVVNLDRYLYERILFNLLSNAIKFTGENGKIDVSLTFSDDKLILVVHDTGIGITSEDQSRLFQRFQQVESSSTRRFEGTGLGLSLVKEFAQLLGGDVTVQSELKVGSTFTVELKAPVAELSHAEKSIQSSKSSSTSGRFQQYNVSSSESPVTNEVEETKELAKILIAEDNIELANYISTLLSPFAHTLHAKDGACASELVKSYNPDLVLLDVMMPKKDGITLCKEIKSSHQTSHIPVILITALTHRDALTRGWEAGANEYLFKPFHPKELVTRIKLLLKQANNEKTMQKLNAELISSARLAGRTEVAIGMLHNIGNLLNSVNVTSDMMLEKLTHSSIKTLEKLQNWTQTMLANPNEFFADKKNQADLLAYLSLLCETQLKEQNDYANDIITLNKYIQHIKDAISIQKDLSGPLGVVETFNISELLDNALVISLNDATDITVHKNYHVDSVTLDRTRLHQIMVNLICNAKEAFKDWKEKNKELTITTQCKNEKGIEWVEIIVHDNGPGISADNLTKIFNFGFTTKNENTGIGLHISAISAQEMGGSLYATSEGRGLGSTFYLTLPKEPSKEKNWIHKDVNKSAEKKPK
jgi:signal transduction histidine kinase